MADQSRREVIVPEEVGMYHVWVRTVRQAFLCGVDPYTGKNYDYRRNWICAFEETLAGLYAIEIAFHAEMSNHLHLVIRNRPDVVKTWSDREVVERWLKVSHLVKSKDGKIKEISEKRIDKEMAKPKRIEELRRRLADPSSLMASLNEHVARRSNHEDGKKGHFWDQRFGARRLEDDASVLVCGIYVDLNQIRAGEASTPETSVHTSAFDRIVTRQQILQGIVSPETQRDGWLCPLTLVDGPEADGGSNLTSKTGRRASDKGILSIPLDDYLELLDFSGRQVKDSAKGSIPVNLAPILDRLQINSQHWTDAVQHFHSWFGKIVGSTAQMAKRAAQNGRSWYRGKSKCSTVFG